jgi:hypothetical protein
MSHIHHHHRLFNVVIKFLWGESVNGIKAHRIDFNGGGFYSPHTPEETLATLDYAVKNLILHDGEPLSVWACLPEVRDSWVKYHKILIGRWVLETQNINENNYSIDGIKKSIQSKEEDDASYLDRIRNPKPIDPKLLSFFKSTS